MNASPDRARPSPTTARMGRSGIEVSRVGLGTMMFGAWGNQDEAECQRMVDIALDRGVTLFDTADMYDDGRSEEILGAALAGRRDRAIVATKVGNPMGGDPTRAGLSPAWVRRACDDSLRRLRTDHIDLYQMHRPDPTTPVADTMGAMHDLVVAGKVRAIGTSTFSAAQLSEVHAAGEVAGVTPTTSEQPPYSILVRGVEREVLAFCAAHDLGVVVWAPLNGGWLTGKYQDDTGDAAARASRQPEHFDHRDADMRRTKRLLVGRLVDVARHADISLIELALGFVLSHPAVTSLLVGPRTPDQLDALLTARHLVLDRDLLDEIDAVVAPGTTINPADDG